MSSSYFRDITQKVIRIYNTIASQGRAEGDDEKDKDKAQKIEHTDQKTEDSVDKTEEKKQKAQAKTIISSSSCKKVEKQFAR